MFRSATRAIRTNALLIAVACTGDTTAPTDKTGETASPTGETGIETSDPTEDASFVLEQRRPAFGNLDGQTQFGAMFVASDLGVVNLAQCVGFSSFCATAWPEAPGDSVVVEPYDPKLLAQLDTLAAGPSVQLGPWRADYAYDSATDLGFYFRTWDAADPASGGLDVVIDGGDEWPAGSWSDALRAPTPMELRSHNARLDREFYSTDVIPLRWKTGNVGEVYLLVTTPSERRLHWLEDDGAFDLDLRDLGLADGARVDLSLGRWSRVELDAGGRSVSVVVQNTQPLTGSWRTIASRDDLTGALADTCAQAESAAGVGAGYYEGDFTGFADDLDPGPGGCTGFDAAAADAILPIDVQPNQELTATYTLLSDDASLYLLTSCHNESTCLAASDGPGEETLRWTNEGDTPQRVYLVLDGFDEITDSFRLDLLLTTVGGDVLTNSCADAIDQGPIGTGLYEGSMIDHLNLIPEYYTCGSPATGGEGIAEIYLAAGQTLNASVRAPDAFPRIHLVTNCSIGDSCFMIGDQQVSYQNSTSFGQTFYLILDSYSGIGDYLLDVEIQ